MVAGCSALLNYRLMDGQAIETTERESIAKLPYEKSIVNLFRKLNTGKNITHPVYLFGYDWRLSNVENGRRLNVFVQYLKEKLKPHQPKAFHFITHSMGGLVFGAYLNQLSDFRHIGKVILCAPPFLGSPYALIHMIKGDGGFGSFLNNIFGRDEDIREVVRTFPSIYKLLPVYENAITYTEDNKPLSLLEKRHWQPNVYVRMEKLFDTRLKDLRAFCSSGLADFKNLPLELRQRMVILAGIEDETLIYLKAAKQDNIIQLNRISKKDLAQQAENAVLLGGDGTVPAISATVYKDHIKTIALKKETFLEELGNNVDFHGLFMRDSRVQNILERYLSVYRRACSQRTRRRAGAADGQTGEYVVPGGRYSGEPVGVLRYGAYDNFCRPGVS
jgi:pimeloyl-ACP methyl ester carboxylesterase